MNYVNFVIDWEVKIVCYFLANPVKFEYIDKI